MVSSGYLYFLTKRWWIAYDLRIFTSCIFNVDIFRLLSKNDSIIQVAWKLVFFLIKWIWINRIDWQEINVKVTVLYRLVALLRLCFIVSLQCTYSSRSRIWHSDERCSYHLYCLSFTLFSSKKKLRLSFSLELKWTEVIYSIRKYFSLVLLFYFWPVGLLKDSK
jgi:hypothetical protein